jgi:lysophospholipase L1-like esterase
MTIRFVNDWNGYKEGQTRTLSAADEAAAVAARVAVSVTAAPDPQVPVRFDPASNALVGPDGKAVSPVSGGGNNVKLPKWRRALAKVRAGTANANLMALGDSTTAGSFATGNGYVASARSMSYPTQLAALMATATGLPINLNTFAGSNAGSSDFLAYDPRWTSLGTNWTVGAIPSFGGSLIGNNNAGNYTTAKFQTSGITDTVDIWYLQNTSYGTFTVSIDGGQSTSANIVAAGAISMQKVTKTFTRGSNHVLEFNKVADGNVFIAGFCAYDSQVKSVNIFNGGYPGKKASDFVANTNVWDPLPMLGTFAPDLTLLNININDWIAGTAAATFTSQMQTIITQAQLSGDVLLQTGMPSKITSATQAAQDAITVATRLLAQPLNIPVVDVSSAWCDYTTAVASGYFLPANDVVHPGAAGYANAALLISQVISA